MSYKFIKYINYNIKIEAKTILGFYHILYFQSNVFYYNSLFLFRYFPTFYLSDKPKRAFALSSSDEITTLSIT